MPDNYILRIGSLIDGEGRAKSDGIGDATPVIVNGLERAWNSVAAGLHMTAVGVIRNGDSYINGVISPAHESEMPKFYRGEVYYTKSLIKPKDIRIVGVGAIPDGRVWVYVVNIPGHPTSENPIVQSYVDVVMSYYLPYGEDFAREFVHTTQGWDAPWINDRKQPRYPNPVHPIAPTQKIDRILEEVVRNAFRQRIQMII